ncbi:hypothetical protein CspeluHIS016_0902620 [Cutaneotrichosporon spelunceum]|uniref:Uncharacterized protein n=1 Tax=Cutaneotrichosporon spelunceum TaxID=1672016 RepID=A0AAD3U037_9TREE|nr:hypothetical protein CspeluHIS016_0902620 [Cutaneotrichosporon spelunceum]
MANVVSLNSPPASIHGRKPPHLAPDMHSKSYPNMGKASLPPKPVTVDSFSPVPPRPIRLYDVGRLTKDSHSKSHKRDKPVGTGLPTGKAPLNGNAVYNAAMEKKHHRSDRATIGQGAKSPTNSMSPRNATSPPFSPVSSYASSVGFSPTSVSWNNNTFSTPINSPPTQVQSPFSPASLQAELAAARNINASLIRELNTEREALAAAKSAAETAQEEARTYSGRAFDFFQELCMERAAHEQSRDMLDAIRKDINASRISNNVAKEEAEGKITTLNETMRRINMELSDVFRELSACQITHSELTHIHDSTMKNEAEFNAEIDALKARLAKMTLQYDNMESGANKKQQTRGGEKNNSVHKKPEDVTDM